MSTVESETPPEATLIIQGDDISNTTMWYRWWLDEVTDEPLVWKANVSLLLEELDSALPTPRQGETLSEALQRAFTGPLTDRARERDLMERLGARLLPGALVTEILNRMSSGIRVTIRLVPAPSCARVPWELVVLPSLEFPSGRPVRVMHLAAVVADAPAGFYVGRSVSPRPPGGSERLVGIIDPDLGRPGTRLFTDEQRAQLTGGGFEPGSRIDARDLSESLRSAPLPDAFLFVGHVTGSAEGNGATALRLSPVHDPDLPLDAANGQLTARDLVLGTKLARHVASPRLGSEIWPMPARVGIIACNSGADLGRQEPFGLIIAALNAGAEVVLGTRWVIPADRAFRAAPELLDTDPQPLLDLALAAAELLAESNPIEATRRFLLGKEQLWSGPESIADGTNQLGLSPVTWGALSVFSAPHKHVERLTAPGR